MTVQERPLAVADVLDAVEELSATIAARSAEIEAARRLPRDLLDELIAAGCFRLIRPQSHGGLGATLSEAIEILRVLARADASVAWTVMIGAGSWIDLTHLPRATFDAMFAATPDAITAGVFAPTGSIAPVDGAYSVTGRWSFASGCEHADWLFGNCVEGVIDGVPQLRIAVFEPDQVVIEDTWRVSGLCGTGSHHFHVDDVVIPAEWTAVPLIGEPCIDAPFVRIWPPAALSVVIASVALGIADGALDDIVTLASGKVPLLDHSPLATNASFQRALATADTDLRAARLLINDTAEMLWATGVEGEPLTLEQRARVRSAGVWATDRAVGVVEAAYRAGGGTSLYADCPLQRRLRDVNALTQHFLVKPDTLTTAGAILAGQDVSVMVF
jgi:alkylation response protein AidB-like acyl-CoA dehydrogenase